MKLPNQTKGVKRQTYDPNAVTAGANAAFFGSLLSAARTALPVVRGIVNSI